MEAPFLSLRKRLFISNSFPDYGYYLEYGSFRQGWSPVGDRTDKLHSETVFRGLASLWGFRYLAIITNPGIFHAEAGQPKK